MKVLMSVLLTVVLIVPAPLHAMTTLPTIVLTTQMVNTINVLKTYNNIVKAGGTLTDSQLLDAGHKLALLAYLFENAGITQKIDQWIYANRGALLVKYPTKVDAINSSITYGSHAMAAGNAKMALTVANHDLGMDCTGTMQCTVQNVYPFGGRLIQAAWLTEGQCKWGGITFAGAAAIGVILNIAGGPETPWAWVGDGMVIGSAIGEVAMRVAC